MAIKNVGQPVQHTLQWLLVTLAVTAFELAQSEPPAGYPCCAVVDLGTFGGPNGWTSGQAMMGLTFLFAFIRRIGLETFDCFGL